MGVILAWLGLASLGFEPWWEIFSAPVQAGPGSHSASCREYWASFLAVKWLILGTKHPPSSSRARAWVDLCPYNPTPPCAPPTASNSMLWSDLYLILLLLPPPPPPPFKISTTA